MKKRCMALVLTFVFCLTNITPAFASEITDFSEQALRVSDEYAAQYPNGTFSLSSVSMETHEYSDRSVINVIRQGGSIGKSEVTIKAVDVSAKIGEDYKLSVPGLLLDHSVNGDKETPTLLESEGTEAVTDAKTQSGTEKTTPSAAGDTTAPATAYSTAPDTVSTGEKAESTDTKASETEITGKTKTNESGNIGLRAVKEQATGKASDRDKLAGPNDAEMEQLNTAAAAAEDFYASAPGTSFTLTFADGERVKSFNLDMIDDKDPEAQEQIIFVITGVTGDGVIGLQKETTVNIIDDEPYEEPVIGFSTDSFTAEGDCAKITVTRTAGVNYFAGARIYTSDDSAKVTKDYTELDQKILFKPGETELSFKIPTVKNESEADKYFNVKLEPNESCTVSGEDTVQVLIPRQTVQTLKAMKFANSISLMGASGTSLLAASGNAAANASEGVMLGVENQTLSGNDLQFVGSDSIEHGYNGGGWYDVIIHKKYSNAGVVMNGTYNLNAVEKIDPKVMLYPYGGHGNHYKAWIKGYLSPMEYGPTLYSADNKADMNHDEDINKVPPKSLWNYDQIGSLFDYCNWNAPVQIKLMINNGCDGDKAAMRVYSVGIQYFHYEFDVLIADEAPLYTFDFNSGKYSSVGVTPGKLEITTHDEKPLKGFYTSEDVKSFTMKVTDVKPGFHLTGIRFYKDDKTGAASVVYPTRNNTTTVALNSKIYRLLSMCNKTVNGVRKLIVQPVFERDEATLNVSMQENDKDKGGILGVINDKNVPTSSALSKTFTTDRTGKIKLHTGDKVTLTGVGYNTNAVTGYEAAFNGGSPQSVGAQNAGIYTATLTETVNISPVFVKRQLTIQRDPDDKKQHPNIKGKIIYNENTLISDGDKTDGGQIDGVLSGQHINLMCIPPEGYTTKWAIRTGDTNGNAILDPSEYLDPNTHRPYRMFDYDNDGLLDEKYTTSVYGDLYNYRVNQPNPILYYTFVPLKSMTLSSNSISGMVFTNEYDIKHGYTIIENTNGEKKTVTLADATLKMGGIYDSSNPNTQIGYEAMTDKNGIYKFNFSNLIKAENYALTIDNNGASFFVDSINTTSPSNYILPTFTSMETIGISATSTNKLAISDRDTDIISLEDVADADFVLETRSLENNVEVDKAIFRVYDQKGTMLSETTEDVSQDQASFKVNSLIKTFKPNSKLTVQLVDQNKNASMEYDSGFEFRPALGKTMLLPSFAAPVEKTLPIINSVMGALDLGSLDLSQDRVQNKEGCTIRLGSEHAFEGKEEELKDDAKDAEEDSDKGDAAKKKVKEANKNGEEKKDSNVKVKSSINKKLNVKVSLEMALNFDSTPESGAESQYYFDHLSLMVSLGHETDDEEPWLSVDTEVVLPIGLAITTTFSIDGTVTGYIYIEPITKIAQKKPIKVYADKKGNFPYTDSDKFNLTGGLILEPSISLKIKSTYAIVTVEVKGTALFKLVFTTDNQNKGTVTLKAGISVTALGGLYTIYEVSEGTVWKADLFDTTNSLTAGSLPGASTERSNFETTSRDYLNNRSGWLGASPEAESGTPSSTGYTEKTLMQGAYPNPDTQLMRIDEDSLLMVFMDDNEKRTAANRGAVYYCVSDNNGATFSQPVLLSDDGTLDSQPRLADLGDRILCLYSSMDSLIMDKMSMEEVLESNGLEMAFFDKGSCKFTKPVDVTKYTAREDPGASGQLFGDYYSDQNGNAVYDADTGLALIIYTKSDYTSDLDRTVSATDMFENYSSIAYMLYDTTTDSFLPYKEPDYPSGLSEDEKNQWDMDWYGQRFLNTEIVDSSLPGGKLSDPLVYDLTAAKNGSTAYIAYTVDLDGDMTTTNDKDIYLKTYNFTDKTFSKSIKISDLKSNVSAKTDGKPQLVLYNGEMYLFYTAETAIQYCNVDNLLAGLSSGDETVSNETQVALPYSEENLPTDDYKAIVGDDGKLYLVWTEETLRLADGNGSSSETPYNEDQIYASVFYEDTTKNIADSEDVGGETTSVYGKWSGKVQITEGPGSYNDIGASVMKDGRIIITAKKSEQMLSSAESTYRVDNPDTAKLVALALTPAAKAEMKQDAVTIDSDYPMSGDPVTLTAAFSNQGLMPILNPVIDFYAVQGETETLISTAKSVGPVYGGCTSSLNIGWTAPEDMQNTKIVAKFRNGDDASVLAQAEKAFPYGVKLSYGMIKAQYLVKNQYKAYAEVCHDGNQPLTGAEFVINRIDADGNSHELKRVSISDTKAADTLFVLDKDFELANPDLTDGSAEIEICVEKGGQSLVKQTCTVEKTIPKLYKDIISKVSSVTMPNASIYLSEGTKGKIAASIAPVEVAEDNHIVYVSSAPAIASVSTSGEVTALANGNAVITAYAVPNVDVKTETLDGHSVAGNLLDYLSLEDCKSSTVTVKVNEESSDDSTIDIPKDDTTSGSVDITADSSAPVRIATNGFTAEFDRKAIAELLNGAQSGMLQMSVTASETSEKTPMYTVSLKLGDKPVTNLKNSSVKISIPYALKDNENPNAVVVNFMTKSGERKTDPSGRYHDGKVTFSTSDLSKFEIVYNLKTFTDVDKNAWYADAVTFLSARGIASGIGENQFAPSKPMTREEFVKFIAVAYGLPWSGNKTGFTDVKQGSWYEPYIGALYEAGVISGTGNGQFGIGDRITRQDMVKILYAVLQKKGIVLNKTREYTGFNDDSSTAEYAAPAIKALYEAGIINGSGNNKLAPTDHALRSSMAAILKKALELDE